jgi:hypothetical protein
MTRDEILGMEPGPELNLIVCCDVMGYEVINDGVVIKQGEYLKPFSEDIAVAWEVVEKIAANKAITIACGKECNLCQIIEDDSYIGVAYGKTAPEAICKAALLAMMEANE